METITKNIFGQYLPYKTNVLSESDIPVVNAVLNGIADGIQAQLEEDEFIKETSNFEATLQYVVGIVNANLPEGITKVDGTSLSPLLKIVIKERVDGYTTED